MRKICLLVIVCLGGLPALSRDNLIVFAGNSILTNGDFSDGPAAREVVETVPASGETSIFVGDILNVQPQLNGMLYFSKIRQNYIFYGAGNAFNEEEYASHASFAQEVMAGKSYEVDTSLLIDGPYNQVSGDYELLLVSGGLVVEQFPVYLAFTQAPVSPDYEVWVQTAGQTGFTQVPTFFSYRQKEYVKIKLDGGINRTFVYNPSHKEVVASHSFAGISTDDYPITVKVKLLSHAFDPNTYFDGARRFSYPLGSAKVLPSSYGIDAEVVGNDEIVFTLEEPRKVSIVPNYDQAMQVFVDLAVGYTPVASFETGKNDVPNSHLFNSNLDDKISEGYKNPLILLARGKDTLPGDLGFSKTDQTTLVVQPGDQPTQEEMDQYQTIWFEPGLHDFSRLGTKPDWKTLIQPGQTFYLEEGAYVAANFKNATVVGREVDPFAEECRLVGRGIVSGINHQFGGVPNFWHGNGICIEINHVEGITFTDRSNFGIAGGDLIHDVGNLGAWHGNTGGIDFVDNCVVSDSFLIAHDDNLKVSDHTTAENLVIMQTGNNAHPVMVHEMVDNVTYANTTVRDTDIIAIQDTMFNDWRQISIGALCCIQSRNINIQNFLYSNIHIESPYVQRPITFFNLYKDTPMGTADAYTADWFDVTTEERHTRISGVTFENITVTSPLVLQESLLGSSYADSFTDVSIINLIINGTGVTEENMEDYFEISGYVLGTDPADGGSGRVDIADPVKNIRIQYSFYSAWEHEYALTRGAGGDDDFDGVPNLLEFALNGDPKDPANMGLQPQIIMTNDGFYYNYLEAAMPNPGVRYTVETSSNLAADSWQRIDSSPQTVESISEGYNSVSNWIPLNGDPAKFIRLRIDLE